MTVMLSVSSHFLRLGIRHYCAPVKTSKSKIVDKKPLTAEIERFLNSMAIKYTSGHTCFAMTCPKFVKFKLKDVDSLYVNKVTGHFLCRSCKKSGSWNALQDNMKILQASSTKHSCFHEIECDRGPNDTNKISKALVNAKILTKLDEVERHRIWSEFGLDGFSVASLERYDAKYDENEDKLLFPCYGSDNRILSLKEYSTDGKQSMIPRADANHLFGLHTITGRTKRVILTASEMDAIAVYQETKLPALALSKDTRTLPQSILPLLEQFEEITIWFGNDVDSWNDAKMFAKKLGENRCKLVRPGQDRRNARTCLRKGQRIADVVRAAQKMTNSSIITFRELRQEVYAQLTHADQVAGVKWKRYPKMNSILKGHRRGELTVFTGSTGSGKTTFISDYSLDLCEQGVNTLWGSFEITNVRLTKMMLQQYARRNLYKSLDDFEHFANSFEQLPMYFMTFHGQETIQNVIETMSHSVYVYDIAHIVVDNLQFMMGTGYASSADRFWQQDSIISAFRRFATQQNCHVTLVIHPRKEDDDALLSKSSIFGSAKATQESDNILILQDQSMNAIKEGKKYIQVVKNRFDGELGSMMLKFDKESLSFSTSDRRSVIEAEPVNESNRINVHNV